MLFGVVWFGQAALLYLSNRGELKFLPEEGLTSVIVLQNDEGDLTTDKLHAPMTDWLSMTGKTQRLALPPGRYQLNVATWPAGTRVSQWSIATTGLIASDQITIPVIHSSAIVTVERGQRVTLRAIVHKPVADLAQHTGNIVLHQTNPEVAMSVRKNEIKELKPSDSNGGKLAKRRYSSNEWIDVIPLIDPQADKWDFPQRTGKNAWRIENGELVVGGDSLASKLVLPLDSDWPAFECELEITRRAGNSGLNVNIPTTIGECPLLFDPAGTTGAFLGSRPKGVQLKTGMQLVTGQRATIRFDIRRQQDADHVSVSLNGAAIGEWTGDRGEISYSYREGFPHDRRLSLWIHPGGNEFVFHRIRVRMLDGGTVETLRPVLPGAQVSATQLKPLPPTFKNSLGMEFVIVPKGKSWLGGGKDKLGDMEVNIPADFYLGKYEVTQDEWEKVMGENPSHFSPTGEGKEIVKDIPKAELQRFPVDKVSWTQAKEFANNLNERLHEAGWRYRLPTEAEWEYACRGGQPASNDEPSFDYYLDQPTNVIEGQQANFKLTNLNRTCKVGSYPSNRLGLHDMHGNAWEWCNGSFDGSSRPVRRGGGWFEVSTDVRAITAHEDYPTQPGFGLRLARVPSVTPAPSERAPTAVAPITDIQRILALPAAEQVEEVRKELKRLNSKFDGTMENKIENDLVTELKLVSDEIVDISPVRALQGLVSLKLSATQSPGKQGRLSDISPLRGLRLTDLDLGCTEVTNIEVLREMPLKSLSLDRVPVSDLSPLTGKVFKSLHIGGTKVKSLSDVPIAGSEVIHCHLHQISDKSQLQRWGVRFLDLWGVPATAEPEGLRALQPPLSRVNGKPLEEFLKEATPK